MFPPTAALLLLALSSSAAFPCSLCDAGYESCGVCLNRVERAECPTSDALDVMANCTGVPEGVMCEADGECGTSTVLNNCENMNWGGASCSFLLRVRVRVTVTVTVRLTAPRTLQPRAVLGRCILTPTPLSKQASQTTTSTDASRASPTCCPCVPSVLRVARVAAASSRCLLANVLALTPRPSGWTR